MATDYKAEALHRLLPLIERAARETNAHLSLHQHFAEAARKPQLELAGGRLAAINGTGVVPSQSAEQVNMAGQCAGLAQAHLNDLFKFVNELQKALQEKAD